MSLGDTRIHIYLYPMAPCHTFLRFAMSLDLYRVLYASHVHVFASKPKTSSFSATDIRTQAYSFGIQKLINEKFPHQSLTNVLLDIIGVIFIFHIRSLWGHFHPLISFLKQSNKQITSKVLNNTPGSPFCNLIIHHFKQKINCKYLDRRCSLVRIILLGCVT